MVSRQQTAGGVLNLDRYRTLSRNGVHASWAGAAGWAFDAYDLIALTLVLTAIGSTFGVSSGQTALIVTVTLIVSALGGISAGVLADRIGRVRTLMLTVGIYSVFAFLSGFAQSYEQLLVPRALQGFGLGLGAFFPLIIGFLAGSIGLTAAIVFGCVAYALALVSLLFLPETRGKEFVALD